MSKVSASSRQNPETSTSYNVFSEATTVNFGSGGSDIFQYEAKTGRMTQYKYRVNGKLGHRQPDLERQWDRS